jgi:hypothetical protein
MHFLFSVYYELTASRTIFSSSGGNAYTTIDILRAGCYQAVPPDDEQVVLETCTGC